MKTKNQLKPPKCWEKFKINPTKNQRNIDLIWFEIKYIYIDVYQGKSSLDSSSVTYLNLYSTDLFSL